MEEWRLGQNYRVISSQVKQGGCDVELSLRKRFASTFMSPRTLEVKMLHRLSAVHVDSPEFQTKSFRHFSLSKPSPISVQKVQFVPVNEAWVSKCIRCLFAKLSTETSSSVGKPTIEEKPHIFWLNQFTRPFRTEQWHCSDGKDIQRCTTYHSAFHYLQVSFVWGAASTNVKKHTLISEGKRLMLQKIQSA